MANVRLANAANAAACDAIVDLIDVSGPGTIKFYTATQPATAETAITSQTLIGTLTWSATAFGAASTSGIATASAITGDSSADATGTITWARIADGAGATIFDCDVSTSAATINLSAVAVTAGDTLDITSFTATHPSGV